MWVKTAIRRLAKRIPQSPDIQRAAALDERADAGVSQELTHIIDVQPANDKLDAINDKIMGNRAETVNCPITGRDQPLTECESCQENKSCPAVKK